MNLCRFLVSLPFLCFVITITASSIERTHFTGDVSINCGSTGTCAAQSGREWLGDVQPRFFSSWLQINGSSTATTAARKSAHADPTPHQTARFSRSRFSYTFQVNAGQKIIRLHFNPTTYRGFKGLKDLFSVEAGSFTLLSNFSASLTADALGVNTFSKEFCLKIQENQQLHLAFSAESSPSLDTYAFINGIEIISVPGSFSYFLGGDIGLPVVGQKSLVYVDNSVAIEIVHRISIEQNVVSSADGSVDMFAMWSTAPKQQPNNVNNITWKVPVDVGFRYLVRLHFSEIRFKMAKSVGLNFKVLINEVVASTDSDIVRERDDSSIPWYEDYVVMMNGRKQEAKRNILICMQSNQEFMDIHGPLKGFEILKLSNHDSSLAAPNPLPPSQTIQTSFMILDRRNAIVTIAITIISLVNIIVYELRKSWEASSSEEENKPSAGAERVCHRFSLAEIQLATRNFNEGLVIGKGGFGKVYKGLIDKGQRTVAVKKLKPNSKQGAREFLTEIETLSELRHINLVPLIGFCNEHREMIIVYEYMACGSLADHLYKLPRDNNNCSSLIWKQRLDICIGVARGLEYLHTGRGIIHRDLKASNILLDENFVAKVSDFGLAKPEVRNKLQSHVSTNVKGTFGYVDPYYVTTSKLIRKSDTYSFGVVLLEVLCGRRAVDSEFLEDEQILTKWARDKISKGEVDQIIDSSLREEISPKSLKTFVGIAGRCLDDEPTNRPTMSEVVLQLEFALKQQESNQNLVLDEIANVSDDIRPSTSNDGIDLPSAAEPTITTTTNVQNLISLLGEQTSGKVVNADLTSGRKQRTKFTTIKLLKSRPWYALWKRVKPSKKNELSFSDLAVESLQYDFAKLRAATDDFSYANKLGEGGFGSVYKGKFLNGQEIAVKRLSTGSHQGNVEFKNEVLLLARIQHKNLVRLLGCCLEGKEMLLVYEFVENSSLDRFIFDPIKRSDLGWDQLYKIIQGTAMGLLYLHEGSQLRIVHRDLKASNVLLDGDFSPKISDFGMARILGGDETQLSTRFVVGTYGYMAPEYAIDGLFSVKSDIFSFGVLVLEILWGKKNRSVRNGDEVEDLLSAAWKNWKKGTAANLIDPMLRASTGSLPDMLRCIHIGLLCVQQNPGSRPTMASIALMLSTSTITLPIPSKPAFFMASRDGSEVSMSQEYRSTYTNYRRAEAATSQNDVTVTELSPRNILTTNTDDCGVESIRRLGQRTLGALTHFALDVQLPFSSKFCGKEAVLSSNPTYITDDVSINCGSTETSAAHSGREWLGDMQPRLPSLLQLKGLSMTSTVIHNSISADPVPHETARLSRSQFSYMFQVNPGQKIIRLHFNPASYRGFEGLLDLFTVEAGPVALLSNFSASLTADALGVDNFVKEFFINIQENQHLIISFSPKSSQTLDTYAFINGIEILGINGVHAGFEIVKLSMDGSLASRNPLPPPQDSPSRITRNFLGSRNVTVAIAITVICLVNIIVHKLRENLGDISTEEENKPSPRAAGVCCRFTLAEIQQATRNFSEKLLIGRGGFGNVYRGLIDEGKKTVAIKKLNSNSMQGAREFLTEIETLSELRHVNLVSLIGYCDEHGEMILVYDYMAGGTLGNHLYKPSRKRHYISSLTWKQRLKICIGAGRGLDYLHTGHGVIHRDVKPSNILLDENFVAKVSDFGLAKPENRSMLQTHVSTKVKGTWGYLDPHYFHTSKLTRKSDTYAFGVVLLEVLCGRPAVDLGVTEDEQILIMWVRDKNSSGEVDQIVDLSLRDEISPNSLKTFVDVADRCLEDDPNNRPTMSQVVLQLELALQQQESKQILVSSDVPSSYEETGQSVDTEQSSVSDIEVQNLTLSPKGQTNYKVFSAKRSRFWSWSKDDSSKENELLLSEIGGANVELIIFEWRTLSSATNKFSSKNKVGKGGFGSVYKGVLPTGQVVAVKRRSASPTQTLQEFKNEIFLLPNLRHQNIIKLLGYCIHSREKLLVYEFMENKSIDTFLDDEHQQNFPWPVRFNVIKGIARGLAYLHQDSELRVIHGDPKSSNILLDNEMIPKISDFGFSTALLKHQSELETGTAAGTPFYISPERLKQGRVSVKSDVYCFGVVILEIVSGQKAWRSYTMNKMNLDDYARKLRSERKVLHLVDGSLGGAFSADEATRCIQVALWCTLEHPDDRPDMPTALKMLDGDVI
ncbi:hypothetical protein C2S52_002411 [Perilla frutescens var. hirtella]|nr:hypothetical protein C2S52_002411 [Perilla frutescens var. hirtella]